MENVCKSGIRKKTKTKKYSLYKYRSLGISRSMEHEPARARP